MTPAHPAAPYASVAILGPGLLGGSIALAIREKMPGCRLSIWARDHAKLTRQCALHPALTGAHLPADPAECARGAELVILATPIGAFASLCERILPALSPRSLVTDVGSVKNSVHAGIGQWLTARGIPFIGSHPMAGGEKQGMEHARANLLHRANIALTNPHAVAEDQVERLSAFWHTLGGTPILFGAQEHDETVARISHVPHLLAALCARGAAHGSTADHLRQLASSGFRDTSRVSSGDPAMWAGIVLANAGAIRSILRSCVSDLETLCHLLDTEQPDAAAIQTWLREAKDAREGILSSPPPPTA
ncbi:MAG: prephenate dehydrogenase [Akkermansiaceae bacterium]|nr:prephenate dehydrogenase [Akkermansiaceae bacterium]